MPAVRIAPSILAADFADLGEQVRAAEAAGADQIHVDVMDGHFVPNISIGAPIVRSLRPVTRLPLDVHLMITNPERYLETFAEAGADILSVHIEACPHVNRVIQQIKALGLKAGIALNPGTPLVSIEEVLPDVDLVLVMSVNPGFGGQAYIPGSTSKIARLRKILEMAGLQTDIEVDGGIDAGTISPAVGAGATIVVAGSSIFNKQGAVAANINLLRSALHSE
jgi:ribulose-phosphate 3-epimerase